MYNAYSNIYQESPPLGGTPKTFTLGRYMIREEDNILKGIKCRRLAYFPPLPTKSFPYDCIFPTIVFSLRLYFPYDCREKTSNIYEEYIQKGEFAKAFAN